jgi:hypothetical protein
MARDTGGFVVTITSPTDWGEGLSISAPQSKSFAAPAPVKQRWLCSPKGIEGQRCSLHKVLFSAAEAGRHSTDQWAVQHSKRGRSSCY